MLVRLINSHRWASLIMVATAGAIAWVLNFASLSIAARRLHEGSFGLVNLAISLAASMSAAIAPNLNVWGARKIAGDDANVLPVILDVNGFQSLAALVLFCTLAIAYRHLFSGAMADALILANVTFFAMSLGLQWVAQGLRRLDLIAANQITSSAVTFLVILQFVRTPGDISTAIIAGSIGTLVGSVVLLAYFCRAGEIVIRELRWPDFSATFTHGMTFGATSVLGAVILSCGYVIVEAIAGTRVVGLYSIGARLYGAFLAIPATFATVMFPRVARLGTEELASTREIDWWLLVGVGTVALPAAMFIFAPRWCIELLFSNIYLDAVPVVRSAGVGILFSSIANIYAMSVISRGGEKYFLRAQTFVALFCVIVNSLGTYYFGLRGASICLCLSDILMLLLVIPYFRKIFTHVRLGRWVGPFFGMAAASLVLSLGQSHLRPVIGLAWAAIAYCVTIALVVWGGRKDVNFLFWRPN